MTRAHTPRSSRPADRRLLEEARLVADTGDRWLVSAAHGVQRAGTWARRELVIIGDSARAAWHTTVDVSRRLAPGGPQVAPRLGAEQPPAGVGPAGRGFTGLDLLPATPVDAARSHAPHGGPRLELLLRMLSELVSEYGVRRYAALEGDDRFWTLINLLQRSNPRVRSRRRRGLGSTTGESP